MKRDRIHQPRQPSSGSAVNASVTVVGLFLGIQGAEEEEEATFRFLGAGAGTRWKR